MAKRHPGVVTFGVLGILFGLVGLVYNTFLEALMVAIKASPDQFGAHGATVAAAVTPLVLASGAVNIATPRLGPGPVLWALARDVATKRHGAGAMACGHGVPRAAWCWRPASASSSSSRGPARAISGRRR